MLQLFEVGFVTFTRNDVYLLSHPILSYIVGKNTELTMTGLTSILFAGTIGIFQLASNWNTYALRAEVTPIRLAQLERPFVIAHRGLSKLAPENTIPSFQMAIKSGADWVELDYYHTSDGVPVCFHDGNLSRTSNAGQLFGPAAVKPSDLTAEQFARLDCGSWFSDAYRGTHAPTLEEALETIIPQSVPLIERKDGDADTLCSLIKRRNWTHDVVTQSFDWDFIEECHEQLPDMLVGVLGPITSWNGQPVPKEDRNLSPAWVERAAEAGASFIGWNQQVTREGIQKAHEIGLKVLVYTINDAETAAKLINLGVDGIITDNPAIGWKGIALSSRTANQ